MAFLLSQKRTVLAAIFMVLLFILLASPTEACVDCGAVHAACGAEQLVSEAVSCPACHDPVQVRSLATGLLDCVEAGGEQIPLVTRLTTTVLVGFTAGAALAVQRPYSSAMLIAM